MEQSRFLLFLLSSIIYFGGHGYALPTSAPPPADDPTGHQQPELNHLLYYEELEQLLAELHFSEDGHPPVSLRLHQQTNKNSPVSPKQAGVHCPALYSPVCACIPHRSFRAMTFHHECLLSKYLLKHPDSEACILHEGMCTEEDRTCSTKIVLARPRSAPLACQFARNKPATTKLQLQAKGKSTVLSKLPIIFPRGSIPR